MNRLILFGICLFSIEVLIRLKYTFLFSKTLKASRKAIKIILNKKISDHWKEIIIPKYSLNIMVFSLQMLLIFLFIFSTFLIADFFLNDFLGFIFSLNGIFESILFAFSYAYLRKLVVK